MCLHAEALLRVWLQNTSPFPSEMAAASDYTQP